MTQAIPPIPCRWNGEAMVPMRGFAGVADRHYVIGEVYKMSPLSERSEASHRHEFAWLREAWQNLPEHLAEQFPTAEHLRKRALVDAGFYNETVIDAGTQAAALRVAAFARGEDEFAVVITRGPLVVVRKPKSQSHRAMEKDEFQASKTAILERVSDLIGVSAATLTRQSPEQNRSPGRGPGMTQSPSPNNPAEVMA